MRELKFEQFVDGEMIPFGFIKGDDGIWFRSPMFSDTKKYPVRQYTRLKDKNGVEIYDGDIVHWGHVDGFTECIPRKAVVKLEPALCFETFNLGKNNHTFHFGSFAYAGSIDRAMEVIGNIHQNPELLEQK